MTRTDRAARPGGRWRTPALVHGNAWFPGRWIGGVSLVVGPVAWSAGLLLRHLATRTALSRQRLEEYEREPFAAPSQLDAYLESPALMTAGYACFAAGALLLWPAFVTFARIVSARCPGLALWGGTLVVLSLFARLYFAGVDHTAFQLAEAYGLDRAGATVTAAYTDISYGPWRIPVTAAACQYAGMALLAVGAFRSGTFGLGRCLLFLGAGTLWVGVLKASHLVDGVLSSAALCAVFAPLGIAVLRDAVPELRIGRFPAADRRPLRGLSW
ncbi:hypothetical protein [Streptomyces sp. NPDC014894]|uniref:hypothetical protein n=1 Tax=Streptomyces sp. NPDC014894 TaxID=3364931 RepID=UPI0036F9A6C0